MADISYIAGLSCHLISYERNKTKRIWKYSFRQPGTEGLIAVMQNANKKSSTDSLLNKQH